MVRLDETVMRGREGLRRIELRFENQQPGCKVVEAMIPVLASQLR
jgi:hypothetical protein